MPMFPITARMLHRLVLTSSLSMLTGLGAGCTTQVVTDAPLSAEESRELEEQRTMIDRQLARETGRKTQG